MWWIGCSAVALNPWSKAQGIQSPEIQLRLLDCFLRFTILRHTYSRMKSHFISVFNVLCGRLRGLFFTLLWHLSFSSGADRPSFSYTHISPYHPIFTLVIFLYALSLFLILYRTMQQTLFLAGLRWFPANLSVSIITAPCVFSVFSCSVCATFWVSRAKNKWWENQPWFVVCSVEHKTVS